MGVPLERSYSQTRRSRIDRALSGCLSGQFAEPLESRVLFDGSPVGPPKVVQVALDQTTLDHAAAPVARSRVSSIAIKFDQDVAPGLDGADLFLLNVDTGQFLGAASL